MNLNSAKSSNKDFPLPEAGMQLGIITQIVGLGLQPQKPYQGQEKPPAKMVRFTYELPNDQREFNGELKPLVMSEEMPFSGHEKSRLYKRVTGIDPNLTGSKGNLDWFVGKPVMLQVIHSPGKGQNKDKVYANLGSVTPVPKGMPVPQAPFNTPFMYDPYNHNEETFRLLPEFLQNKITSRLDGGQSAATQSRTEPSPSDTTTPVPDEDW